MEYIGFFFHEDHLFYGNKLISKYLSKLSKHLQIRDYFKVLGR